MVPSSPFSFISERFFLKEELNSSTTTPKLESAIEGDANLFLSLDDIKKTMQYRRSTTMTARSTIGNSSHHDGVVLCSADILQIQEYKSNKFDITTSFSLGVDCCIHKKSLFPMHTTTPAYYLQSQTKSVETKSNIKYYSVHHNSIVPTRFSILQ